MIMNLQSRDLMIRERSRIKVETPLSSLELAYHIDPRANAQPVAPIGFAYLTYQFGASVDVHEVDPR